MTGSGSRTPDVGRIYDALLGGKDNYAEDWQAARRLIAAIPDVQAGARANRRFLGRAIRFLAGEGGIRQFIDIGAGLPTAGNSRAVAHEVAPDARVAYVDTDPVVIAHAQGLLGKFSEVCALLGDLRDPMSILDHPDLRAHIDLRQPTAILAAAVLHFIPDEQRPYQAVSILRAAMAPGSYLVLSHGTHDNLGPDALEKIQQVYAGASAPAVPRTQAGIARFFDGLEMVTPGLCDVAAWRPGPRPMRPARALVLGGIGRKP
jgi:hypothetical protein